MIFQLMHRIHIFQGKKFSSNGGFEGQYGTLRLSVYVDNNDNIYVIGETDYYNGTPPSNS